MKKRLSCLLLALALIVTLLPGTAMAVAPRDDITTSEPTIEEGVYQIGTAEELAWFRDHVNAGNYTVSAVLTDDIDLNNRSWTPIGGGDGYATTYFGGTFDGKGFAVSKFTLTATYNYAGFMGYLKGNVQNLRIEQATITSSSSNVGGIAGKVIDGIIQNCSFSGTVTNTKTSSGYAGGIAGYMGK